MGVERAGSGRVWAWLLLLLGGGVSIAVNIGHAHIQSTNAVSSGGGGLAGWAIAWAMVWAVLVPLMLFVAVKGFTAIRWPQQRRWTLLRLVSTVPAALLAGYMSWSHMSGLLRSLGEDWLVCVLAWLAVDGLMLLGTGGLLATRTTTASTPTRPVVEANGTGRRSGSDAGLGLFEPVGRPRGGV